MGSQQRSLPPHRGERGGHVRSLVADLRRKRYGTATQHSREALTTGMLSTRR